MATVNNPNKPTRSDFLGFVNTVDADMVVVSQSDSTGELLMLLQIGTASTGYHCAYLTDEQAEALAQTIRLYLAAKQD